ncbi:MAG: HAD hydrolase-like protein [Victivallales bacterium]|nr:HAD hydrolase-like protein [Victivallales bacterium]MCF7889351.1 HAD hydrolase-like protein [Victivallales bacterium]
MRNVKHVIWDWNGTIINDSWLCIEIINKMLSSRDKPQITEKIYSEVFDFPAEKFYKNIGFDFSEISFDAISAEFMLYYEKRKYECVLHEHFTKIQPCINKTKIEQSILTAYPGKYLKDILLFHKLHKIFAYTSGLEHIKADSKIENGKKLIERIGTPRENCLYVGDTIHDLDAAEAMGIECYLFPSGHNSLRRLLKKTDKIIKNYTDLKQILNQ